MENQLKGKVALVTGANKGIGLEIARQLGHLGATVIVAARRAELGTKAVDELRGEGLDASYVQLDVTDAESVERAARDVESQHGRLDILVNNAGVALDRNPPSKTDMSSLRQTFETNVFGIVAVTNALLPLLRRAPAGRIVNLSSGLGSLTLMSDPNGPYSAVNVLAYCASKSAVNAVTVQYGIEFAGTSLKVNAADPGYVATDLNGHSGPRTVQQGAAEPVRLAMLPDEGPSGGYFSDDGQVPW